MIKMKKDLVEMIMDGCLLIFCSTYLIVFMYFQNVNEVTWGEIRALFMAYMAVAILVWIILLLVSKKKNISTVVVALASLIFTNGMTFVTLAQKVFGFIKYWHVVVFLLFVLVELAVVLFPLEDSKLHDTVVVMTIAFTALFLINIIPKIPILFSKITANSVNVSDVGFEKGGGEKPNVYWFIFDECASFEVIKNYYGYDNAELHNYLANNGFVISENSRNECGNTEVVLTNCLNLEYVSNSDMTYTERELLRENAPLYELFNEKGYSVEGIGDTEWLKVNSKTVNGEHKEKTVEGKTVSNLIIDRSIIAPFAEYNGTAAAKTILDTFAYFDDSDNLMPNQSMFNVVYVCSPHQPFLFDENGNDVDSSNYNNWDDEKYYLGQYKFVSAKVCEIVSKIIEVDEQAIIILQSDHGPRFNPEIPYEDKINILNAVRYPQGDVSEICGQSSVNTWRAVLNEFFGCDYAYLEVKEYGN